jgi:RNA 2',3'-cyclic 3'-phosphodiesterase
MENKEAFRLFVAVALPEEIRCELYRIQKQFKRAEHFEGNYVQPQHLHITLKFLGNIALEKLDAVKKALATVKAPPFEARVERVDLFGSHDHAQVLLIALASEWLNKLHDAIEHAVSLFVAPEKRPYVGHVTLARIKKVRGNERFKKAVQECKVIKLKFAVSQFVLMRSDLSVFGPEYKELERFSLV